MITVKAEIDIIRDEEFHNVTVTGDVHYDRDGDVTDVDNIQVEESDIDDLVLKPYEIDKAKFEVECRFDSMDGIDIRNEEKSYYEPEYDNDE